MWAHVRKVNLNSLCPENLGGRSVCVLVGVSWFGAL